MKEHQIRDLLLRHTHVIKKDNVIKEMRSLVSNWKRTRQERDLFVSCNAGSKIGSEQWIYLSVLDILPSHTILTKATSLTDGCEILYMDDWSLSGCNACAIFEDNMYMNKASNVLYTFIFYLLTDEASSLISSLIERVYPHVQYRMINHTSVERFDHILENEGIDIADPDIVEFHRKYNPDTQSFAYPIVSDYKIPNQFGSYPTIYGGIYPIDRRFMRNIEKRWKYLFN